MSLNTNLQRLADAYQQSHVIHHCAQCSAPCCRLDALVLELDWKQVKVFWGRSEPRAVFDKLLSVGQGPQEIRPANNLYYVHTKPCPVYDQSSGGCKVYNQPIKPVGCTDFPVYVDGQSIVADLRCEAVDLKELMGMLSHELAANYRITESRDPDFPFLVTLQIKRYKTRR